MLHGDIKIHYSLCLHALQLMRIGGGRSLAVLVFPRVFPAASLCHPKKKKGLSVSLEAISHYFLLLFFMAFLLYEIVCLRELLLSSFDIGGELH